MKAIIGLLALAVGWTASGANAWMQQARKTPAWFTEGVMYQIQPRAFTPFVRRGKGETVLVVQNWTDAETDCEVKFDVPDNSIQSYIVVEGLDRNVRGTIASEPLLARKATRTGVRRYKLGPYGFAIVNVGL